jgi:hypothetical protein
MGKPTLFRVLSTILIAVLRLSVSGFCMSPPGPAYKFDRVSESPHAGTALEEVHVGQRTKRLAIAVSVTALDGVVAGYYGGVVWRVFSGIIWSKLLVLLLAAVWATSLLHLWALAYSELRDVLRERGVAVTSRMDTLPVGLMEDGDV